MHGLRPDEWQFYLYAMGTSTRMLDEYGNEIKPGRVAEKARAECLGHEPAYEDEREGSTAGLARRVGR